MGSLFSLPDEAKTSVRQVFDDMIADWGKDCRLYYPPRWVSCPNCLPDPIGGKSSNHWRTGGPIRFTAGTPCPMCNGEGRRAEEVSEVVHLLCAFEPKHFFRPVQGLDLRVPYGVVQTKGFLADLPKIERCDYMVFQVAIEGVARRPYKLLGEPGDAHGIIQARYFVCSWERKG